MEGIQWSGVNSYGLMTANVINFGSNFLTKCKTFSQLMQPKNWHGLAPMGHQEQVSHCITTYKTHMEDIQWSGGNLYGFFMTANVISFGTDFLTKCQTFSFSQQLQPKSWHGSAPMGHYRS
jgi:hypothetical protein